MADAEAKVLAMVARALKKAPNLTSRALFERAVRAHETVGQQSVRQFHARYVIPAKRKLSPPKRRKTSAKIAGRGRSPSARARKGTPPPITEMIEAQIDAMRGELTTAAAEAAERALKSGQISDVDKLSRALRKATRELSRV